MVHRTPHRIHMSAAWLLAFILTIQCQAQTLDEILQKNYAARGGLENIRAVKSVVLKGVQESQGKRAEFTITIKRPHKMRAEIKVDTSAILQVYDGRTMWMLAPSLGIAKAQELPPQAAAEAWTQSDIDGVLIDTKAKGISLEFIGRGTFEGRQVFHVKQTAQSGEIADMYIDAATGLQLALRKNIAVQGQTVETVTILGDWRKQGGVMFAFTTTTKANGAVVSTVRMREISVNAKAGDALFVKP